MEWPFPQIPWHTPALWREANFAMGQAIERHYESLAAARHLVTELHQALLSIFQKMEKLCAHTCPSCQAVCCRQAVIWMDYKDLLFIHLAGLPVPEAQPLSRRGERCRHLGPDGCCLDRIQRPFVCTWYLCPAQTRWLRKKATQFQRISHHLQQAKDFRKAMEDRFIATIL